MNTEALKKLGLTQEQIDAIMAENGKDIKAEQDKAEGLKKERDGLQTQLSEANETIKGYKDMDIDAIKKSAGDWEDKYKASVKELEDMRFDSLLDKGLTGSGAYDADIVKKLLDREALIVKDGKLEGLDKQADRGRFSVFCTAGQWRRRQRKKHHGAGNRRYF
ncbi:MAG: phage scaffolding protein [Peptococcus niger]|nr:phage scaffolding protein [Peptococcus niger]